MAQKLGIQGLIISNHGGRQVDGAVSSIEQLPLIRKLVGDDFPLILDSGVRTGADIMKAVHQGADLVSIGRPYVYALALGGETGVQEYLRNLQADLDLHMRLSGCCNLQDIKMSTIKKI
jgi:lactate 2-monooxygenase